MTDEPKKPYRRKDHPEHMTGLKPMKKGDPNRNPGGLTKESRALREEQARKADLILNKMIDAVGNKSDGDDEAIALIRSDVLKLLHTAIERVEGKAKQAVDLSSTDGTMSPAAAVSDAVLEALKRKHDPKP